MFQIRNRSVEKGFMLTVTVIHQTIERVTDRNLVNLSEGSVMIGIKYSVRTCKILPNDRFLSNLRLKHRIMITPAICIKGSNTYDCLKWFPAGELERNIFIVWINQIKKQPTPFSISLEARLIKSIRMASRTPLHLIVISSNNPK